jgi:hypothetical protein
MQELRSRRIAAAANAAGLKHPAGICALTDAYLRSGGLLPG